MRRDALRLDRRALLHGAAALACWWPIARSRALAAEGGLLDPQRVEGYSLPLLQTAEIDGGKVTYALQGPERGPPVVYFHGWGDDYRIVLPLEYPLVEAGFRLLVVHRPGYAGSALEGRVGGRTIDRRTAAGNARMTARLLDHVLGEGRWRVQVVGTSGGAPAALAFASLYHRQTRALILQAGVTQPWTDARYVPDVLRDSYLTAFKRFGWTGDRVSQVIFGLLAKLRETSLGDDDKVKALAGARLAEIQQDPAYKPVVATVLRENAGNGPGELNDARSIFFAKVPYARWTDIRSPVLIVHDPLDPFVPFAHAQEAKARLPSARLEPLQLGGHVIWLGRDARAMHAARVAFLRDHV